MSTPNGSRKPSREGHPATGTEKIRLEFEIFLADLLPGIEGQCAELREAMRYATLDGGKRLRPILVAQSAQLCGASPSGALHASAAIEIIHCYSLIHDDLPAMDNDDLRRGKPTCHRAFGEATAILAGDALLTLAFEILAMATTHHDANVRIELVRTMARAAGLYGMVGGQSQDLAGENFLFDLDQITTMQKMKTGALLVWACCSGAILAQSGDAERDALRQYGEAIGLAFQIADDLLDATENVVQLGKRAGKDKAAGKATFVSLLGMDGARRRAHELIEEAKSAITPFGKAAHPLMETADFILNRRH